MNLEHIIEEISRNKSLRRKIVNLLVPELKQMLSEELMKEVEFRTGRRDLLKLGVLSLFGLSAVGSAKAAFFERTDGSYMEVNYAKLENGLIPLSNIPLDKLLIPCVPHQTIAAGDTMYALLYVSLTTEETLKLWSHAWRDGLGGSLQFRILDENNGVVVDSFQSSGDYQGIRRGRPILEYTPSANTLISFCVKNTDTANSTDTHSYWIVTIE